MSLRATSAYASIALPHCGQSTSGSCTRYCFQRAVTRTGLWEAAGWNRCPSTWSSHGSGSSLCSCRWTQFSQALLAISFPPISYLLYQMMCQCCHESCFHWQLDPDQQSASLTPIARSFLEITRQLRQSSKRLAHQNSSAIVYSRSRGSHHSLFSPCRRSSS